MSRFIIEGGHPLSGTFRPMGNKNAALPMIAACLLTDETVHLDNVPHIRDVENLLALLADLGVSVRREPHAVTLCAASLRSSRLSPDLCRSVRGSILLAGPLAARHGAATLSPPGGDVIGRRRLDTHFDGLSQLGISMTRHADHFLLRRSSLFAGADILLDEASVTATENILMAAVLAPGDTTLLNAASEPHVQSLARLLCQMGAQIDGIGTNQLLITGVPALRGASARIAPDYIEVGSLLAAAAATHGSIDIDVPLDPVTCCVIRRLFQRLGVNVALAPDSGLLSLPRRQTLRIRPDLGGAIPKIEDGTWPAIPSDLLSVALVLATQARGDVLFFEKLFESRMYFVDRLLEMGARVVACDPHRVLVSGPAPLRAKHMTSPDIRAGMALIVAALAAQGTSVIDNADMVDRGYEAIEERLRPLGAHITREA
jgi:UDP-N-acetylglucosamine 1-carboxyvinyltransferase